MSSFVLGESSLSGKFIDIKVWVQGVYKVINLVWILYLELEVKLFEGGNY